MLHFDEKKCHGPRTISDNGDQLPRQKCHVPISNHGNEVMAPSATLTTCSRDPTRNAYDTKVGRRMFDPAIL